LLPDHAPVAVQDVASVEAQVRVDDPPLETDAGFADSDTAGNAGGGAAPPQLAGAEPDCFALQAASARMRSGMSSRLRVRNMGFSLLKRSADSSRQSGFPDARKEQASGRAVRGDYCDATGDIVPEKRSRAESGPPTR
jgi:hypothetical protein